MKKNNKLAQKRAKGEKMKVKNKTGMGFLILESILFCLFSGLAHAQQNWITLVNGGGNSDWGNAVIEGKDGYLYVAGALNRIFDYTDFAVIKIREATGDTIWTYRYICEQNAEAVAICTDSNYNIYAVGHRFVSYTNNNIDIVVVKLDTAGVQKSVYTYANTYGPDSAFAICYGRGNLYVAGTTDITSGTGVNLDYLVLKIDTLGSYKGQFRPTGLFGERANSIVYAGDYIYSCGINSYNFRVYKNDTTNALNLQSGWPYSYNGIGNGDDEAKQVIYGGDGKIYAAGYSWGGSGTNYDFTVVALNNDGSVYWGPYIYNGRANGDDCANSLAYQNAGNLYAAGYSTDSTGTGKDFTVIDLSTDLTRWIYRYNGIGNLIEEAGKIVVSGNYAYAAGYIRDAAGAVDVMVAKFDPTHGGVGAANPPYWVYTYDVPGITNDWDLANDIAISNLGTGNLYVTGVSFSGLAGNHDLMAMSLPENFPPYIPVLINPADGGFLNNFGVTFRWYKSTDPEGNNPITYVLKYDTLANFATADSQVVITDTFKTVTFADSDAYYYWKVKAKDSGGRQSIYSAARSFGFDFLSPNTPVLQSPIDQAIVTDTSVTFQWTSVTFKGLPAPVRYIIQVDTNTSFTTPIKLDTVDVTTKLYNLNTDDWYYWHVQAYDLAGNQGSYSGYEDFGVDITNPLIDSVTILYNTELLGPFDVYAKVTDFFGIDSVVLYYKRMEDPTFFPLKMNPGADPAWYIAQIPAVFQEWDTIQYYFWAKDNAGHTSTNPDSGYYWFVANAVGIAEHQATPVSFSFGLRSNPAKGRALFNLALPQDAFVTLRIYDVSGRLIDKLISGRKSAGYYQIPWAKDVSSGIFFYHLDSPWQQKIGKLVLLK